MRPRAENISPQVEFEVPRDEAPPFLFTSGDFLTGR